MGVLQLQDFRADVIIATQRNPGTAYLDRYINAGLLDVASSVDIPELDAVESKVTANGVETVALTDSGKTYGVKVVRIAGGEKLDWMPIEDLFSYEGVNAQPKRWSRHGDKVYLKPIPDAVYNLELLTKTYPVVMASASDTSGISEVWDTPIKFFAIGHAFDAIGEQDRGQYWRQHAINYISTRLMPADFDEGSVDKALPQQAQVQ